MTFRFKLLLVCAGCFFSVGLGQRVFADTTNSPTISTNQPEDKAVRDSLNALLQIQDQLHTVQLLIESNQTATASDASEAQRNATNMSARIQALKTTVATQHTSEIEATQKAQRLTLILVGGFGVIGLTAMLLMAYFQWRAVTRLVELSTRYSSATTVEDRSASPLLSAGEVQVAPERTAAQLSNTGLFNVVEHLEKRVLELEHTAHAPLAESTSQPAASHNGAPSALADRDECIANLLSEGQSSLNYDDPEKAVECFDQVLALDSKHAQALVKKAGALEKLNRFDEALVCYDDAIAADRSMTIAYLQKGGLFNRLSRYEEALQCYEHALHTHTKELPEKEQPPDS